MIHLVQFERGDSFRHVTIPMGGVCSEEKKKKQKEEMQKNNRKNHKKNR